MSQLVHSESSGVPAKLLVTTALEETWSHSDSTVFLGEWCKVYDRKNVWSIRPHQVVRNHWDDRAKLRRDHDYLKCLHDSILVKLASSLNSYHQLERPLRYWRMIVDPWLLTYVAVLWDRWECLRIAFEEHGPMKTVKLESVAERSRCFDYGDFIERIVGDSWNYQLFLEMIEYGHGTQCRVESLSGALSEFQRLDTSPFLKAGEKSIKHRFAIFVDGFLGKIFPSSQVVIFDSYFSSSALIKLNLCLKQLPRFYLNEFEWPLPKEGFSGKAFSSSSRQGVDLKLDSRTRFEKFLASRIVDDIPSVYMEGFSQLQDRVGKIAMKPKAILTANAHWGNDLFKLWSAEQVLCGTKYVLMEHGGSIPPAFSAMSFEEECADVKTTWATPFHKKHRRLPSNKVAQVNVKSSLEHLAIVGYDMPRYNFRVEASPKAGQVLEQCDMVCDLFFALNEKVQESFRIKPYPNKGWNTRARFAERLGDDKVSRGQNYRQFLSSARVVVCTYPQTTFSEAMVSGLPTILLYPAHLWETIPEMRSLLDALKRVKILFHNASDAANHINSIWAHPDQWWSSSEVLCVRNEFHRDALDSSTPWLASWMAFIREVAR
jgi:putative transferase (TIGR04331 family)